MSEAFSLIDYHMHSAVTVDGRMSEAQACERAVLLGIREIAFTNHVMLTEPKYAVSPFYLRKCICISSKNDVCYSNERKLS